MDRTTRLYALVEELRAAAPRPRWAAALAAALANAETPYAAAARTAYQSSAPR